MAEEQTPYQDTGTPNFFDYQTTYPSLDILKAHHDVLVRELETASQIDWFDWPEQSIYPEGDTWNFFPFYAFSKTIKKNCELCPETARILSKIPDVWTALYSRLGPQSKIHPHQGWGLLANHILRCHYGLQVPDECGIWVAGEYLMQQQGEILVFDDSKPHLGFNFSDQERTVLLIDIKRPSWLPEGQSKQEVTDELDMVLQHFGVEKNDA